MARKLDDIFNECFERILQGESFDSCLARYPEHAAELEPLLRTAFGFTLRASSTLRPRPAFKHWSRVRLQGAQLHPKQQQRPQKPGFFSWQRSWAVALTAILVVLLTGGGTVAASADAMPDRPLYPVKLATEQVKLAFAFSDTSKAEVNAQLTGTRAEEIETMVRQGKTEQAAITAERLANQLEQANYAIERVEITRAGDVPSTLAPEKTTPPPAPPVVTPEETPTVPIPTPPTVPPQDMGKTPDETPPATPPTPQDTASTEKTKEWKESLEGSTSKSLAALQKALEQAPPEAKPALQQAINRISEKAPKKPQQVPGIRDKDNDKDNNDKGKSDDEGRGKDNDKGNGKDETKRTPSKPEQSQPSTQNEGKTKNDATPSTVTPQPSQPSSTSDNNTRNGANPVPSEPNRPHLSTHSPTNNSRNTNTSR